MKVGGWEKAFRKDSERQAGVNLSADTSGKLPASHTHFIWALIDYGSKDLHSIPLLFL